MPFVDGTLIRFVLVGITNTVVGLSVTFVAWHLFGLGDWLSNALGYLIGFLWSFALNRLWSFKASAAGTGTRQFWRFTAVCAVSYAVNVAVLALSRSAMGDGSFAPLIIAMVAYSIVNYLGSRFFVFVP